METGEARVHWRGTGQENSENERAQSCSGAQVHARSMDLEWAM